MNDIKYQYDLKKDSKNRITLRESVFNYYRATHFEDGRILLEPRVLIAPFQVSENTLNMMDRSMENYKAGNVSEAIDLSEFED